MSALATVHVVCAVVALLCSGLLAGVAIRRRSERLLFAVQAVGMLAAAAWAGNVARFEMTGSAADLVFWLPSVSLAAAAALFWTRLVVQPGWSPRLGWVAVAIAEPLGVLAARQLLGTEVLVKYEGDVVVFGWVFAAHSAYCFILLVATVVIAASRWNDATPHVQVAMRALAVGAVGAILAEALRLQLTDVVVVVTMIVVAGAALSAPRGALAPRVRPEALVDHVGALVLVLDGGGRLRDMNAPARAFFAAHDVQPPAVGDDLTDVFRELLDAPLAELQVELEFADTPVALHGHAEQIGPGASAGSWVVVLRHRVAGPGIADIAAPDSNGDQAGWAEELSRLSDENEPAADVVAMGLLFVDQNDAVRAANALRYVAGSLEAAVVAVGVVESRTVVAVAPRHLEGLLVDVVSEWWGPARTAGGDLVRDGVRVVSLAPALVLRPVVRYGRADGVAVLLESMRHELAMLSV